MNTVFSMCLVVEAKTCQYRDKPVNANCYLLKKNLSTSGPTLFKLMLFKDQWYSTSNTIKTIKYLEVNLTKCKTLYTKIYKTLLKDIIKYLNK